MRRLPFMPAPRITTRLPAGDDELLTSDEVAELLKVSRDNVYWLHTNGRLPRGMKVGRQFRWRKGDVLAHLAEAGKT